MMFFSFFVSTDFTLNVKSEDFVLDARHGSLRGASQRSTIPFSAEGLAVAKSFINFICHEIFNEISLFDHFS